jgi:hypothetical protein
MSLRDRSDGIERPVQIECELTIRDPNGAEEIYAHTQILILPGDEDLRRRMTEDGSVKIMVRAPGPAGCTATARFRRIQ